MNLISFQKAGIVIPILAFFGLFKNMESLHSCETLTSHKFGTSNVLVDLKRLVAIILFVSIQMRV